MIPCAGWNTRSGHSPTKCEAAVSALLCRLAEIAGKCTARQFRISGYVSLMPLKAIELAPGIFKNECLGDAFTQQYHHAVSGSGLSYNGFLCHAVVFLVQSVRVSVRDRI